MAWLFCNISCHINIYFITPFFILIYGPDLINLFSTCFRVLLHFVGLWTRWASQSYYALAATTQFVCMSYHPKLKTTLFLFWWIIIYLLAVFPLPLEMKIIHLLPQVCWEGQIIWKRRSLDDSEWASRTVFHCRSPRPYHCLENGLLSPW